MILDLENSLWQFYFCTFSQNTIISFKYVDFWSEIMLLRTHIWKSSIFQSFNQSCSLNIHWLKDYLVDGQKLSYAIVRWKKKLNILGFSHFQNLIYHSIFSYIFKTNEVEGVLKNNVEMLVEIAGLNDLKEKAQKLEEGTVIQN